MAVRTFPEQLGHRAFGSRAQRSRAGSPAAVEKYHGPWRSPQSRCPTGTPGISVSPEDPRGVTEKLREEALGGLVLRLADPAQQGWFLERHLAGHPSRTAGSDLRGLATTCTHADAHTDMQTHAYL